MRLRRSRLTRKQSERLLEHFVAGTSARPAAELAGVNRNTARQYYHRLREIIAQRLAQENPFEVEVEIEKPGTGNARRVPVFWLIKRGARIHTVMPPGKQHEALSPALKTRVRPDAIVYADAADVSEVLDVSGYRHERVSDRKHSVQGRRPIDSVENFWGQAKRQLRRYNGLPRRHLHLFLKECEWRFNYGSPRTLLKILKSWIKSSHGQA